VADGESWPGLLRSPDVIICLYLYAWGGHCLD